MYPRQDSLSVPDAQRVERTSSRLFRADTRKKQLRGPKEPGHHDLINRKLCTGDFFICMSSYSNILCDTTTARYVCLLFIYTMSLFTDCVCKKGQSVKKLRNSGVRA